jgi:hypothetical protein
MRKGKDPEPDPYLLLVDPGGPKTCGSGSPTQSLGIIIHIFELVGEGDSEDGCHTNLAYSWGRHQ